MYLNILKDSSRVAYVGYTKTDEMIKYQSLLIVLVKRSKETPAASTIEMMLIDDPSLFISSENGVFLITQATDTFVKTEYKRALFYAKFYLYSRQCIFGKPSIRHLEQIEE